jgi:3D (Asp-Asp-Asp) domain-containing protein
MDSLQPFRPYFFTLIISMTLVIPLTMLLAADISSSASIESGTQLACLTVYWKSEGDKWTSNGLSAIGVPLREGHCAVDPRVIPYGSVISISGVGTFLAVDTGKAVVSRRAAQKSGVTAEQRKALVVDLFFNSRREAEQFASHGPKFTTISWWAPWCADNRADQARKRFNPEDWAKLQSLGML